MTDSTLWVNPFNGIAGDMMLGALIDAGADAERIEIALAGLDIEGWALRIERTERHGVAAVDLSVLVEDDQPQRRAGDIMALIGRAPLPERARTRALAVFEALARAEGEVHEVDPDDVHFHEVGAVDAIVDIVGVCLALEQLDVSRLLVGPIAVGRGSVRTAHGVVSNPAPATVALLRGWPIIGLDTGLELTTPTGAAIVAALGEAGPVPPMRLTGSGFGAGDARPEAFPNVLHVLVGEVDVGTTERLVVLETNVDDATGETLAHAVERLLDQGALDAWIAPILMKKGRPAHIVSVLTRPPLADALGSVLLRETGSIGFRRQTVERTAQPRRHETVDVDGHEIGVKVTPHTVKAEHEDVVAAAAALDRPVREVAARAEAAWQAHRPQDLR